MGYIDKTESTVTAHFTKRGRELLAEALSGNTSGDYVITHFALGDDEIDYSLYDESQSSNLRGRVIENMPMVETPINEQEVMNFFITDSPPMALQYQVSNIPDQIVLTGKNDVIDVNPFTENFDGIETYEFVLGHDNIAEMYNPYNPPVAGFLYEIGNQGQVFGPPTANFSFGIT